MRHRRYVLAATLSALAALVVAPEALAHGNPAEAPAAGGGEVLQIVIGTLGGVIAAGVAAWVIVGHREGRIQLLRRLGAFGERTSGLPGWVAVPMSVHAGGLLIAAAVALSAFPLDDMWHRIFGQDVTLWGPTHLLLFGGAALTVIGGFVLLIEGRRAKPLDDVP